MNRYRRIIAGSGFLCACIVACSGVERIESDGAAGSVGDAPGGAPAGGGGSGAGTAAGGMAAGGREATAGTNAGGASGSASAGASAGLGGSVSAGGGSTASGGVGGAGAGELGEGGAAGAPEPPPLLKNPSFELGGLAGWQVVVTPDTVGKAIYTQWGSPTGQSIDGMFEVSFWNGTAPFTGDLHQTVTGLVPGKYELKVYLAYGTGINAAYLYAIGCGPSDVRVDLPLTVGVPTFAPASISSIDVTLDSCTVGLFADMNTGDWLNADAFVFDALPAG
jgi:hypothetical protein